MKLLRGEAADWSSVDVGRHGRPLLVVAHPGHELRLFGWLCEARPDVVVLTDGSGHSGRSRIDATRKVLAEVGAHEAPMFGVYRDRQIYRALLEGDTSLGVQIARTLIYLLQLGHYEMVVADPLEGYNPSHDLCRVLVDIAVRRVNRMHGRQLRSFDYALTGVTGVGAAESSITMRLRDDVRRRKYAVATAYSELFAEVEAAVHREGERAYDEEILREITSERPCFSPPELPPFYETYGERQCAAGRYSAVIRHAKHFLPMARAIARSIDPAKPLESPAEARGREVGMPTQDSV
jgi:hypothetical protein